jgi:hypothetical protein
VTKTALHWTESAERVTVEGWVCKTCRRFWGDNGMAEHMARYCCSAEVPCSSGCQAFTRKGRSLCDTCEARAAVERHEKRKREPWDGKSMLYSEALNRFFVDLDDMVDYVAGEIDLSKNQEEATGAICEWTEDHRVLLCVPQYGRQVDSSDIFQDVLPEDGYGDRESAAIAPQLKALNEAIEAFGPVSWTDVSIALDYAASIRVKEVK